MLAATKLASDRGTGAAVEGYDRCKTVSAAVNRIVGIAARDDLSRVSVLARHAALRLRGLPRLLPRWSFEEVAARPHDLVSLGVYEYLHDVLDWQEPTRPMRGLCKIGRSAGWIVPTRRYAGFPSAHAFCKRMTVICSGCSIVHGGTWTPFQACAACPDILKRDR